MKTLGGKNVSLKKTRQNKFFSKKNKEEGLTKEELAEREVLRKEYLENFRAHFKSRLEM